MLLAYVYFGHPCAASRAQRARLGTLKFAPGWSHLEVDDEAEMVGARDLDQIGVGELHTVAERVIDPEQRWECGPGSARSAAQCRSRRRRR